MVGLVDRSLQRSVNPSARRSRACGTVQDMAEFAEALCELWMSFSPEKQRGKLNAQFESETTSTHSGTGSRGRSPHRRCFRPDWRSGKTAAMGVSSRGDVAADRGARVTRDWTAVMRLRVSDGVRVGRQNWR